MPLPKIREHFLPKADSTDEMAVELKFMLSREVVGSPSLKILKVLLGSYLKQLGD